MVEIVWIFPMDGQPEPSQLMVSIFSITEQEMVRQSSWLMRSMPTGGTGNR